MESVNAPCGGYISTSRFENKPIYNFNIVLSSKNIFIASALEISFRSNELFCFWKFLVVLLLSKLFKTAQPLHCPLNLYRNKKSSNGRAYPKFLRLKCIFTAPSQLGTVEECQKVDFAFFHHPR